MLGLEITRGEVSSVTVNPQDMAYPITGKDAEMVLPTTVSG